MSAKTKLSEAVARWLCPEMGINADKFESMHRIAADAYWWLGEFPDATDFIRWLLDGERDKWRRLDEEPISKFPSGIGEFRERLRDRAKRLKHEQLAKFPSVTIDDFMSLGLIERQTVYVLSQSGRAALSHTDTRSETPADSSRGVE